jgi:RimJ/RimL family protein N-acetyltransferase
MDYLFAPDRLDADGFVIRSYRPGDGRLIGDAVNSSYAHLAPFMPWARHDQPLEDSERLAREFRGRYLLAEDFTLGIFSQDESRLLGGTGFHLREGPLSKLCAECGMFIRADAAGAGLGTRVLRAMLAWGFEAWPWLRVSWRCDARNTASIRVAEKAGMLREGVLRGQAAEVGDDRRDTLCFAALKSEWQLSAR